MGQYMIVELNWPGRSSNDGTMGKCGLRFGFVVEVYDLIRILNKLDHGSSFSGLPFVPLDKRAISCARTGKF